MSTDARRILNCGDESLPGYRLLRPCPMRWAELAETGEDRVRFCGQCDHFVHRVANKFEARVRARQGECLAVPPSVFARAHQVEAARNAGDGITIGLFLEGAFIDEHIPD